MKIIKYNNKQHYVDDATTLSKVYLVQEIPTDRQTGQPKFDLTPAIKYGEIKTMFPKLKQMQFSPGPLIIEIKNSSLKEGMYLEAKLNAKNESNAIEINRSLLLDENKIFIVRDNVLDVIEVTPTYFSETKVVLKNIPDNTIILSNPFPGAYVGMLVKPLQRQKENITKTK